jgi:hypothetical protein
MSKFAVLAALLCSGTAAFAQIQPGPNLGPGVDASETLTLFGPAPSLLGYGCEVLAVDWTVNSELRFEPARNAAAALAQSQPLPVPKPPGPGGSCPHGYMSSGSFCVPSQGTQDAIAKPANGTCPWGWTASGSHCLRSGSGRR